MSRTTRKLSKLIGKQVFFAAKEQGNPQWSNQYLTPYKKYNVTGINQYGFYITCDNGANIYCAALNKTCYHLGYKTKWQIATHREENSNG